MNNYKNALEIGFAAAAQAQAARKEVADIFNELNQSIAEASDGKLAISIRDFFESKDGTTYYDSIFNASKMTKYYALVANNPKASQSSNSYQLARWEQSSTGYPCSLSWNGQERQCYDRVSLESALADLLKDPTIGEMLQAVMQFK